MTGHRPIVVGTDGSPSSLQAVSWAAKEAALRNLPLSLITTTFVPGAYGVPIGMPASFFEDEQRDGRERLERAEQIARAAVPAHNIEIVATLCTGTPAGELIGRSATASMVVVGANRQGIVERAFLGSVSSAVAAHAHCTAAVVRGAADRDINDRAGPVVVGVDGSRHSESAISMAYEEAALRQAELVAVHAWSDITLVIAFDGGSDAEWRRAAENETAVLSESLAGRAEDYPDVKMRTVVVRDRPARNLREQAENAQLLVVGSRGRGGFTSMLLGSTSRTLMHSVTCPLLIVR
ncbi:MULTISPECIES: universal stress protein [Rhodococcus]|uniref:Universal stress protein n=1 Tax=Rhodococcus oxybenzonivorans TaxID=1990687 RepID=A0AAE5A8T6_9NOCA|nr:MULTISPECIES: universal stress protein [Rhodococcus]MDV7245300.1 universal stress protein [Rhodococcus oxybenzonivorans]MDV7267114.1 universal stress protein [Rhodococcus oxybenzonivorans]MDV7272420.1 universal stress protein [Rhodococcus oxybenzonivorans]MDV7336325.1 universal stress protein [Rhodococcus oxybenzonivorans]MDV7347625.1 universal stress protein [Rhodococcus oxybenzonivorans]